MNDADDRSRRQQSIIASLDKLSSRSSWMSPSSLTQRMIRISGHSHQRFLHAADNLVTDATIHRPGDPPRTLRLDPLADHRLVLIQELGSKSQRVIEQRLLTSASGESFEQPCHKRGRLHAPQPRHDTAIDQRLHIVITQDAHRP